MRWSLIFSTIILFCTGVVQAQERKSAHPRVVIVVCAGLTFADIHLNDNSNPHLANFAERGTVGLMNCAVDGEKTSVVAKLTFALGQRAHSFPTDHLAGNDWEILKGDRESVGTLFAKSTGLKSDPNHSVKHLGIASLQSRGLNRNRLGSLLSAASPSIKTWIVGNADTVERAEVNGKVHSETVPERSASLLTVDEIGVGSGMIALHSFDSSRPFGLTDNPISLAGYALERHSDLTVIELGDLERSESARKSLSPADYRQARDHAVRLLNILIYLLTERLKKDPIPTDILLVSPRPPGADAHQPQNWNRLTPFIGFGPHFPPGRFLSDTTRTPGVLANVDFAPTILKLFELPIPSTMIGRPLSIQRDEEFINPEFKNKFANRLAYLHRIEFLSNLNESALVPALFCMGVMTVSCIIFGLIALRLKNNFLSLSCSAGLIYVMNAPGAFLLSTILVPPTLVEYLLRCAAISAAMTLLCFGASRVSKISPVILCCLLNTILILMDLVSGQTLLKESALSNYFIGGFRYYGIGNEYLGVMLGYALGGGFLWLDEFARERNGLETMEKTADPSADASAQVQALPQRFAVAALLCLWGFESFAFGWQRMGANAGSLAVTGGCFGIGAFLLFGKKAGWRTATLCAIAGLGLSFLFAWGEAKFGDSTISHAGSALKAATGERGAGYLAEIVLRKTLLNLRLLIAPWTLFTAGLIVLALLSIRALAGDRLKNFQEAHPWLTIARATVLTAVVTSLLFKDTGAVTVCYLLGFFISINVCALLNSNVEENH